METKKFVAVLMGSDSDFKNMSATLDILHQLEIPYEAKVLSAHRTPVDTHRYIQDAEARGCQVFIAAAGVAAHLAGTVAAWTTKPVIGVPMDGGPLNGIDALLSTVQMPGGVPVASMALGKAGAKNAAYFAAQIMALGDSILAKELKELKEKMAEEVRRKSRNVESYKSLESVPA